MTDYTEVVRLVRKGRRAEKRAEALEGCVTGIIMMVANTLLSGWLLMLAIGVLHSKWDHRIHTIGYWWAVIAVYLLRGVFSRLPDSKERSGVGQ